MIKKLNGETPCVVKKQHEVTCDANVMSVLACQEFCEFLYKIRHWFRVKLSKICLSAIDKFVNERRNTMMEEHVSSFDLY